MKPRRAVEMPMAAKLRRVLEVPMLVLVTKVLSNSSCHMLMLKMMLQSETSGAQKRSPSVDLTASCSTASLSAKRLKVFDIERIIMGDELSDSEINHAQRLLQARYHRVNGLRLTLYKGKLSNVVNSVQTMHCLARQHWIATITLNCEVKVF